MSKRNSSKGHIFNYQTSSKASYYAHANSFLTDRIIELKSFASHKILKFKNKLSLNLYNASNTTKSFWISVTNPVLSFLYSGCMYFVQGLIYVFAIPFIRIRIKLNSNHSRNNRL